MKKLLILMLMASFMMACEKEDESANPDDSSGSTNGEPIDKDKILELVNGIRATGCDCGGESMPAVSPLSWDDKLGQAALAHSKDMEDTGDMSHEGSDGSSASDRIEAAGYDWSTWGENVARNYATEQEVFNAWLESSGHCKNMMAEKYEELGVAMSGSYWTMVLAAPQ
jgi:uncharacterized protein YkwD